MGGPWPLFLDAQPDEAPRGVGGGQATPSRSVRSQVEALEERLAEETEAALAYQARISELEANLKSEKAKADQAQVPSLPPRPSSGYVLRLPPHFPPYLEMSWRCKAANHF